MDFGGLQKVRTFKDDLARAQGAPAPTQSTPPVNTPPQKETPEVAPQAPVPKPPKQHTSPSPVKETSVPQNLPTANPSSHIPESPKVSTPQPQKRSSAQEAIQTLTASIPDTTHTKPAPKREPATDPTPHHDKHVFNTESPEVGVVVQEKKKGRWTLSKAIGESVSEWARDTQKQIQKIGEIPKARVAPVAGRKDTVMRAGERATIAPQEDHRKAIERLRTLESDTSRAQGTEIQPQIKKRDVKPSWTHVEKPKETPSIKKASPVPVPAVTPPAPAPSRDVAVDTSMLKKEGSAPLRTLRNDALEEVSEEKLSVPRIAAAARKDGRTPSTPVPKHTTILPVVLVGLAIFLVLGGSIGAFFFFSHESGTTDVRVQQVNESLIGSVQQVPFTLPEEKETLQLLLNDLTRNTIVSENNVVQYFPQKPRTDSSPASAIDFMTSLSPNAPGDFVRNLNERMMFGVHTRDQNTPFFIFLHDSFDVAFAGMLSWEENIQNDFTPLFGFRSTGSFVDERIENQDIRVLYDQSGTPLIVYGFPRQNTLIITGNQSVYRTLVERLR